MRFKQSLDVLSWSVVLLAAGVFAATASAQQTVTSATLSGHVEDSGRAVINGASVTVRNLETKCLTELGKRPLL